MRIINTLKAKIIIAAVLFILFEVFNYWFWNNYTIQTPVIIKFQSPIIKKFISPIPTTPPSPKSSGLSGQTPEGQLKRESGGVEPRTNIAKNTHNSPVEKSLDNFLIVAGTASYYSEDGCLGCDPNLIMANGERLDDSKETIALLPETVKKHKLLNKFVKVVNVKNNKSTIAKVTDTGGFGKYGRVADLSFATKEALGCGGLCEIKVYYGK